MEVIVHLVIKHFKLQLQFIMLPLDVMHFKTRMVMDIMQRLVHQQVKM